MRERVAENLNAALLDLMAKDDELFVLGEDIADPYGGAFKITRGLTARFPDRARTTPISESGLVGLAGGLALAGSKAIAEVMFGDFATLAFDPIVNFISKSVTMYGTRRPMHFVLRCPTGGNRGYGATHSQCLQKHFLGVPNLALHELTPFHDAGPLLTELLSTGSPSILFEDKSLYAERMVSPGPIDDLLQVRLVEADQRWAVVSSSHFRRPRIVLVCHGGMALRCVAAVRRLFLEQEVESTLLVPSRLYPLTLTGEIAAIVQDAQVVLTAEESSAGGSWGGEVAAQVHALAWKTLERPVVTLCSRAEIIPSAPHLERKVLLQTEDVLAAMERLAHG